MSSASAAPVVDQSNWEAANGYYGPTSDFSSTTREVQTFTAGLSGLLTGLDAAVARDTASLSAIRILSTTAGLPATVLGTLALSISQGPGDFFVDLTSLGVQVVANTTYAYEFQGSGSLEWMATGSYAGGANLYQSGNAGAWTDSGNDARFRTHVDAGAGSVTVNPVPLPPTLALVVLGLGLMGPSLRRR